MNIIEALKSQYNEAMVKDYILICNIGQFKSLKRSGIDKWFKEVRIVKYKRDYEVMDVLSQIIAKTFISHIENYLFSPNILMGPWTGKRVIKFKKFKNEHKKL